MEQSTHSDSLEKVDASLIATQVFIQRHAMSQANEEYQKIKDYSNFEELEKWICDPNLRDPRL